MNVYSIPCSVLSLLFYIGFTIISFCGIIFVSETHQLHDAIHAKSFNCTCSVDDTQYQCVMEALRTRQSMHKTWCEKISSAKYQFCRCVQSESKTNRCTKQDCHIIENPVPSTPKRCDEEKCNTCDALELWIIASKVGAVDGVLAAIAYIVTICKAVMESNSSIDYSQFQSVHVVALVPPIMVAYKLLTTSVLKHYSNVWLNVWTGTMLIGFGVPLFSVWMYQLREFYVKTKKGGSKGPRYIVRYNISN